MLVTIAEDSKGLENGALGTFPIFLPLLAGTLLSGAAHPDPPLITARERWANSEQMSQNPPKVRNKGCFGESISPPGFEPGSCILIRCSYFPYWGVNCPILAAGASSR